MPARIFSAATSTGSTSSPSARLRSPEPRTDIHSLYESGSGSPRSEGGSGELKVVSALVGRLVNKLPCNLGIRLGLMEVDVGVQTTVSSLLQLAKIRLPLVVQALLAALEQLSKHSSSLSLSEIPLETLQSQAYLLHVLNLCLSASWQVQSEVAPPAPSELPRCWPDPYGFDESLARHLLSVVMIYARIVSVQSAVVWGSGGASSGRESRSGGKASTSPPSSTWTTTSSHPFDTEFIQRHSYQSNSGKPDIGKPPKDLVSVPTIAAAIQLIDGLIARVIFHLSSSNWALVLSRIKSRLSYLTTTIEQSPDLIELNLLEWSNVDIVRLGQLTHEISSVFTHLKRPAQIAVAIGLRKAIWNWINVYPGEYQSLVEGNRRMDGGPDSLFDMLYSLSDSSTAPGARRVKALYPLMAMLLVASPDTLKRVVGGNGASELTKKARFMESLRKGMTSGKSVEMIAMCYVDFVQAAVCVKPSLATSGVRSLVSEMQTAMEGKKSLYTSLSANASSDAGILTNGLVALYQVDPARTAGTTFAKLWLSKDDAPKRMGLRACRSILERSGRLPWFPSLADFRARVGGPILLLLNAQVAIVLSANRTPVSSSDQPSRQHSLLEEVLDLIATDPGVVLAGAEAEPDGVAELLSTISSLLVAPNPSRMRSQAAKTAGRLIEQLAEVSGVDSITSKVGVAIWQVLLDVARQSLFALQSGDLDDMEQASVTFSMVVFAVHRLAEVSPDLLGTASNGAAAMTIAAVAVVSAFTQLDVDQVVLVSPSLVALAKLLVIVHPPQPGRDENGNSSTSRLSNAVGFHPQMLDDLAKLPPAMGRQQQQRQVRRVLRAHTRPTTSGVSTWLGLAKIVRQLSAKIIKTESDASIINRERRRRDLAADIDGLNEDQSKTWQNIVSFLCATSSWCSHDTGQPPSLSSMVGKGLLPKVYEEDLDPITTVEAFLHESVDLMVSSSVHVREFIREALGSELPPLHWQTLLRLMTQLLSHSMGPAGVSVSDTFTMFSEQAISVLRMLVDRCQANENVQVDWGDIMFTLARYINRLSRDEISLRVKAKFCYLCEAVLAKPDCIVLSDGPVFRNAALQWIVEWATDMREADGYSLNGDAGGKIQRDLDHATLRAMVRVTDGLELRAPGQEGEDSQNIVKSRLFHRYYLNLVGILERDHPTEIESVRAPSMNGSGRSKPTKPVDSTSLVINILSNLLIANIDVGLKDCLALGYHADPTLRTAFMQLIANILRQGTRFGGSALDGASSTSKLYLEAVTSPNLALVLAICENCPPTEVDEVSLLLFRLFEAKGTLLDLLRVLIEREVSQTNHETELFRANSITTRILTIFARTYGYNYVRATLQPLIHSLVDKPAECSFEMDPSKASANDDIERNGDHLRLMCQALLDLICSSTPRVPVLFRSLCHHIWEVVEVRFPDSRHSAVGSFIFLRFFCPAIISPENIDLDVLPDTREVRRALLLITKVIQNLANNVVFGNKEPHMKVLNPFLSENIKQVTKFLSDVAARPRSWEVAAAVQGFQAGAGRSQDGDADNAILQRFVFRHIAKLQPVLEEMPRMYSSSSETHSPSTELDGMAAQDQLDRVMQQSGPPAEIPKVSSSIQSRLYEEFMKRHEGRNTDHMLETFYEGSQSENGNRLFYFIVSRAALVDYDLLAFHVFQILDGITDVFDIVIDLTEFSAATEPPLTWMRRTIQICPPAILPCVNTIAIYNPNSYALRRVRRLAAELSSIGPSIGKNVIAASSPAELADFIPFISLALPESTMSLAYEADHVFTNLLYISDHKQEMPVVVKLGHDCLQIASWRKQELGASLKAFVIDIIQLKDIDDVVAGSGMAPDRLILKHSQTEYVTFITRKRNEMAQIIRAARGRITDSPSTERALQPSDLPGTLLNVALINLSSSDGSLRLGAYNLINVLSQLFKYELASPARAVSTGLNIPNNSLVFAVGLSKSFATSAPHLTLEFLKEWCIGFSHSDIAQKTACLHYVTPWLVNLDSFAKPIREDGIGSIKQVIDIVRSLIAITVAERRGLHLLIQSHVWAVIGLTHEALVELVVTELLTASLDAGISSDKVECVGDILVSLASLTVRGRIVGKLRKTIAQTYLKPSKSLVDNVTWSEICTLARLNLSLAFSSQSPLDTQLFLPELLHVITLLLSVGPLVLRQTVYGLLVTVTQSLTCTPFSGEMDGPALQSLLQRSQSPEMIDAFGLAQFGDTLELSSGSQKNETDANLLAKVEAVVGYLEELLAAGAVSIDCANAWRARWMGLVAATCFQHNPATQPQAFTVLGHLASDEIDDDLVYQILVAMSTTLSHFVESDQVLVVSMLKCLSRIIPGLLPGSRYASALFWLAVGILQLSYIPLFGTGLELMLVSLRSIAATAAPHLSLQEVFTDARRGVGAPARKLDQVCGVSFDTDSCFSLVAVVYKGIRHPSTRKVAIDVLIELLMIATARDEADDEVPHIVSSGVPFFIALLPHLAGSPVELKALFAAGGMEVSDSAVQNLSTLPVFEVVEIPDNSSALMLITLIMTVLSTASSDVEKLVLYRLLADASTEMPEVIGMTYDALIPRITNVLANTSNPGIITAVTSILERALSDSTYTFPSSNKLSSESASSLNRKSYAASISSAPSTNLGAREQVLEDLGMRGLAELSFPAVKMERIGPMAKWVAALIESFTI